jgi:DinB family protein
MGGEAARRLSRVSSPEPGRAAILCGLLEHRVAELFATLRPLSQAQWALPCPDEGWPVGYVAHHIGQGVARPTGWIEQALEGDDPFEFSWDMTHELNARRSQRLGLPSKEEALAFVRVTASHLGDLIGSLTDTQLDTIGFRQRSFFGSIEWITRLVVRHIDEHHASIRATVTRT